MVYELRVDKLACRTCLCLGTLMEYLSMTVYYNTMSKLETVITVQDLCDIKSVKITLLT